MVRQASRGDRPVNRSEQYRRDRLYPSERDACPVPANRPSHKGQACWLFHLGAYGWTSVLVWADHLEDALDECIDWVAENAPGLLADESVREEYDRLAKERGLSPESGEEEWETVRTEAESDTTHGGNCGHYLLSWEVQVYENPSREERLGLL